MDTNQTVSETSAKIAALNDKFRLSGQFVLTNGVMNLNSVIGLCSTVEEFNDFNKITIRMASMTLVRLNGLVVKSYGR